MNDRNWKRLHDRLRRSKFRSRFRLGAGEKAYLDKLGLETVRTHAERFVKERLAPAFPKNDGRQTPFYGHPVFIAQHATGTCCRKCLQRWHGINAGKALNSEEVQYAVDVIVMWLEAAWKA